MSEIKTFSFDSAGIEAIKSYKYGVNWPVVYILENGKELYVGETIRAHSRTKQHLDNIARKGLKKVHVISDDEYNKSATLDTESSLIEYLAADGQYILQNGNAGLQNHEYFDRERYQGKFEVLWKKLQDMKIAKSDLLQIRNSDLFKYSPYKTLTDDQYFVASKIIAQLQDDTQQTYVVHGGPGTGKTILATYLIKRLVEEGEESIALVIAMTSLRRTLQKVFRSIPGLKSTMVIGPGDVVKNKYNVLVVDETHRLRQRKNIPNYGTFDKTNKSLGLGNDGDELDWVLRSAKKVVLFYDAKQSVRPSDISAHKIQQTKPIEFILTTQMRVKGGDAYLRFVDSLLEVDPKVEANFSNYDFKLYSDIGQMVADIKKKDAEFKLGRMVAGYAWKWCSREDKHIPDIVIGDSKLFWNSQITDWVNSPNALNEVGCIHTIQGYDLNYAGVIVGPEISFDPKKREIVVDRKQYLDTNGHRGVASADELKRYIVNIYKTLLTRGILGTYVYVVDVHLRDYFAEALGDVIKAKKEKASAPVVSPYMDLMVELPMFESAGCGELLFADSTVQEMLSVKKKYLSAGSKYFILRVSGDSMNKAGINDGDFVLCVKNYHPEIGNKVVALVGDDATIKEYRRENGRVVLKPNSTNSIHKQLVFDSNDDIKIQGVVVRVLTDEDIS